jgi:hypothetical protein
MDKTAPNAHQPELALVTKANCHLCDDARKVVADVAAELGLPWREERLEDNPELGEQFAQEVPVVLVDGIQRDFWKIDPVRLRRILQSRLNPGA